MLDATVSGTAANSYVTLAEANTYFATRPFSTAWNNTDGTLIFATTMIDAIVRWPGSKTVDAQALENPRKDTVFSSTVIQKELKVAQLELSLHILTNSELFPKEKLDKVEVGPIKLDFFKQGSADYVSGLPVMFKTLIDKLGGHIILSSNKINQVKLSR